MDNVHKNVLEWANSAQVEYLLTGRKKTVYAARPRFYRTKMDRKEVDFMLLQYAEHNVQTYQEARQLHVIRKQGKTAEIQVERDGRSDQSDLSWELLQKKYGDLTGLLQDCL